MYSVQISSMCLTPLTISCVGEFTKILREWLLRSLVESSGLSSHKGILGITSKYFKSCYTYIYMMHHSMKWKRTHFVLWKVTEWFSLERTSGDHLVQSPAQGGFSCFFKILIHKEISMFTLLLPAFCCSNFYLLFISVLLPSPLCSSWMLLLAKWNRNISLSPYGSQFPRLSQFLPTKPISLFPYEANVLS